jgi:hypothetical protein
MAWLLWLLVGLLGIDLLLVTAQLIRAVTSGVSVSFGDAGPLLVAAGVFTALVSIALTARRNASKDFLEAAAELLERAHTTLAQLDDKGRPKNSRLNWLASARFLRAAEQVAANISEPSHVKIFREQREYWRARFYDLISPTYDGFPSAYYAEKPEHMLGHGADVRSPLSERSLTVLYRFVRWPKDFADPIENEPEFTENEIEKMRAFGPRGLGELLASVRGLKADRRSGAHKSLS